MSPIQELAAQSATLPIGLPYPVGARYSNSTVYDEATTEVVHGWQVFEQRRADGTPTGRRSFINHQGRLCGIELAELERSRARVAAAPALVLALSDLLRTHTPGNARRARIALAAAEGIHSATLPIAS